jgi:thiamine biosynthesis lipoprotein
MFASRQIEHTAHLEGVLGTSLSLRITAASRISALEAERAVLAEIDRLERVYSRFLPDSELNRWQATRGEDVRVSSDLAWLLRHGLTWLARSGGAFHPGADALGALWRDAAAHGCKPDAAALTATLETLRAAPYRVNGLLARRETTATLNFNAYAKGRIVDCAAHAGLEVAGVNAVLVNIGGEVRHLGAGSVTAEVSDPASRADNAPRIARVRLNNQGLASSGHAHRGVQVGARWRSHLIDPRNGRPVHRVVGASVIAPDAATADVLATVFTVLEPAESLALADSLEGVGCLIVVPDAQPHKNAVWRTHETR